MRTRSESSRAIRRARKLLAGPVCAVLCLFAISCDRKQPEATKARPEGPLLVSTFTYPLSYFAERIGGDQVEVQCPVPADIDPQFWKPDRETALDLQKRDLLILNGAQLEKWEFRTSVPVTKTIYSAAPLRDNYIVLKEAITHSHGPTGAHSHEGVDGYTWLDPLNASVQAREIAAALSRLRPEHAEKIDERLRGLLKDLKGLDRELTAISASYDGRTIITSHPFFNYLARRYGWKVFSVLLEPDRMPPDANFVELKALRDKSNARLLLWEAQPPAEVAARIEKELSLTSFVFAHCASLEDEQAAAGLDYMKIMKANIENVRKAFSTGD